ncbi:hypothetical protein FRC02_003254 [Tulasnella sp. 418]|nr:hypothetical protein FRC02_003254 [Tulasnella sp. 418]
MLPRKGFSLLQNKSASVQLAVLSYAISLWIDGTTQVRDILGEGVGLEELFEDATLSSPESWVARHTINAQGETMRLKHKVLDWLFRKGRPLDISERAAMAIVQISTSLAIFRMVGLSPLFPFLLSPFLSNTALPDALQNQRLRWRHIITTSIGLAVLHELKRFVVVKAIAIYKRRFGTRDPWSTKIKATGFPLGDSGRDEEDQDCLICSGVGIDGLLPQTASGAPSAIQNSSILGPLEGFCVNAPSMHLMHRPCILRWHHEYQRGRTSEGVELRAETEEGSEMLADMNILKRGRHILQKSGFGYLVPGLQLPNSFSTFEENGPPSTILTLLHPGSSSSAVSDSLPVATLKTSHPPCPGCRSPILLQFRAQNLKRSTEALRPLSFVNRLRVLVPAMRKEWSDLITGRTILRKLLAQVTFVFALISMIQSRSTRQTLDVLRREVR